ncbi:MBL fold metallo-hydrolase [Mangrovicoccus algicola]|uniref:MBL fold metallo-hydrolase n=1 Tax=Mangrovicoccus algicola TaxID=2771008 RepID=A0A8J7CWX5_9RHOB|nr:MBL fold metallo-hydrolase [Mangrovicoccus algicola]MBE3639914.1 MBL fold metallo-hydrolase [Mangrovicoccus algicola]
MSGDHPARLAVTILGCGSSGGVPRLGGIWGECDPANPKNARRRCALLVERIAAGGTTRVLIDTGPDMRQQLLDAGIGTLDAVVYTHAHADHVHGLDDLRQIVFNTRTRLEVWADAPTRDDLLARFAYAFEAPQGSPYPPILTMNLIDGPLRVEGAGGQLELLPFEVEHGAITAKGFRVEDVAYLPDVSRIPETAWPVLAGLRLWIVDALRRKPHPSHAHLALTLDWIARAAPEQAVLTNMHVDLDYDAVAAETPAHVTPAHDGLRLEFDL